MLSLLLAASLFTASQEPRTSEASSVVVPVERVADKFAGDMTWIIATHAGDLAWTGIALERCNGACVEGNPIGFNPEARMAMKIAGTAAMGLTIRKLRRAARSQASCVCGRGTALSLPLVDLWPRRSADQGATHRSGRTRPISDPVRKPTSSSAPSTSSSATIAPTTTETSWCTGVGVS